MSLLDKIKAFFSGDASHDHAGHDHAHDHAGHDHTPDEGSSHLQSPMNPAEPVPEPTPEEIAAASQAEPPTTTVVGLSEDDPDEVH